MAFVPWKDRVTSTPHRYKLTEVSADTYDLEAVPGSISEAGTPVNAENLNKLIQRDGDDIKDTVTTFTEASTRANIATGEKASTIFGKIKKWFTDLKAHAFATPSATLNEGTTSVPSDKVVYDEFAKKAPLDNPTFTGTVIVPITPSGPAAAVAKSYVDGAISNPTMVVNGDFTRNDSGTASWTSNVYPCVNNWGFTLTSGVTGSYNANTKTLKNDIPETPGKYIYLYQYIDNPTRLNGKTFTLSIKAKSTTGWFLVQTWKKRGAAPTTEVVATENSRKLFKSATYTVADDEFLVGDTLRVIIQTYGETVLDYVKLEIGSLATAYTPEQNWVDTDSPQKITGIKTFATGATPLITDAPTTDLMAVNKEYVDGLTPYDRVIRNQAEFNELINSPNWLGATSVALVGQFTYSEANNSGIKVPATVKQIHGFNNAKITVTNFVYNSSTAKGGLWYATRPTTLDYSIRDLEVDCTGNANGYGFHSCTNLTNCTGKGRCTGPAGGYGFHSCTNLTNCTGTGRGTEPAGGYGFNYCTNLTNCTGTGIGTGPAGGYGFYSINYASNCRDGGSATAMWGGTNTNIDLDTCRKTPVEANLTTLNT